MTQKRLPLRNAWKVLEFHIDERRSVRPHLPPRAAS